MSVFTIICPVFNASKYLKECVASVLNQQYKDWELILIDDGSSDDSPKLCDDLSRKDKRVKVIHKINEGPMIARKVGIKQAKGSHIVFLDSDDELKSNALLELNNVVGNHDAVIFNAMVISNNDGEKKTIAKVKEAGCIRRDDIYNILFGDPIFGYLWMYCIKKDIVLKVFEENNKFESIRYTEDLYFINLCARHFDNVLLLDKDLYLYKTNRDSITKNLTYDDRKDRFLVFNEIYGYGNIELSKSVSTAIAWATLSYLQNSLFCGEKKAFRKAFKEIRQSILFSVIKSRKYSSKYLNISVFFIKMNFCILTRLLCRTQKKND